MLPIPLAVFLLGLSSPVVLSAGVLKKAYRKTQIIVSGSAIKILEQHSSQSAILASRQFRFQ